MRSLLVFALVAMLMFGGLVIVAPGAQALTDGAYTYTIAGSPSVATITDYTGAGGALSIAGTLGGYTVVAIGSSAFTSLSNITSVTMPASITSIGTSAFQNRVTITTMTIGSGVTSIGNRAFYGCNGIATLVIPNTVTSIGSEACSGMGGMTSLTIGSNVATIGSSAFYSCTHITSVVIPASVTSIGASAFKFSTLLSSITFNGAVAPTVGDSMWTQGTAAARGHAYAGSNFPAPGASFYGLVMGTPVTSWLPTVTSTPGLNVTETTAYTYAVTANESISLSLTTAPSFLSISGSSVVGTPSSANIGSFSVVLSIRSVLGYGVVWQNYTITVNQKWVSQASDIIFRTSGGYEAVVATPIISFYNDTAELYSLEFDTWTGVTSVEIWKGSTTWKHLTHTPWASSTMETATIFYLNGTVVATYRVYFTVNVTLQSLVYVSMYDAATGTGYPVESFLMEYNTTGTTPTPVIAANFLANRGSTYTVSILDHFGNVLATETFIPWGPQVFISIPLSVYSVKLYNQQSDFILANIYYQGAGTPIAFFVAPNEPVEKSLRTGDYSIAITYYINGTVGSTDTFLLNITSAQYLMVNGVTMEQVITDLNGLAIGQSNIISALAPTTIDVHVTEYLADSGDGIAWETFRTYITEGNAYDAPTATRMSSPDVRLKISTTYCITVMDFFGNAVGNVLVNLGTNDTFIDVPVSAFSFKVFNQQEDFILVSALKAGAALPMQYFVAPDEAVERLLMPSVYGITITYYPGGIVGSAATFSHTIASAQFIKVNGTSISQVISAINGLNFTFDGSAILQAINATMVPTMLDVHVTEYLASSGDGIMWETFRTYITEGNAYDPLTASRMSSPDVRLKVNTTYDFTALDYFGNVVGSTQVSLGTIDSFIDIAINAYSVKVYNQQEDFIKARIYYQGAGTPIAFFVAPNEPVETYLRAGDYTVSVTFYHGNVVGSTQGFTLTVADAQYLMVDGITISQVISDIEGAIASIVIPTYDVPDPDMVLVYEDLPGVPSEAVEYVHPWSIVHGTTTQIFSGIGNTTIPAAYVAQSGSTYYLLQDRLEWYANQGIVEDWILINAADVALLEAAFADRLDAEGDSYAQLAYFMQADSILLADGSHLNVSAGWYLGNLSSEHITNGWAAGGQAIRIYGISSSSVYYPQFYNINHGPEINLIGQELVWMPVKYTWSAKDMHNDTAHVGTMIRLDADDFVTDKWSFERQTEWRQETLFYYSYYTTQKKYQVTLTIANDADVNTNQATWFIGTPENRTIDPYSIRVYDQDNAIFLTAGFNYEASTSGIRMSFDNMTAGLTRHFTITMYDANATAPQAIPIMYADNYESGTYDGDAYYMSTAQWINSYAVSYAGGVICKLNFENARNIIPESIHIFDKSLNRYLNDNEWAYSGNSITIAYTTIGIGEVQSYEVYFHLDASQQKWLSYADVVGIGGFAFPIWVWGMFIAVALCVIAYMKDDRHIEPKNRLYTVAGCIVAILAFWAMLSGVQV